LVTRVVLLLLALLTLPSPAFAQEPPSRKSTVVKYREVYRNLPPGEERGWRIINATCWEHRAEGCGLFRKTSGTNYAGFSIDILIFKKDGKFYSFDVLEDAEGRAEPQWGRTSPTGFAPPEKWAAPLDPGILPPPPPTPIPEPPPSCPPPPACPTCPPDQVEEVKELKARLKACEEAPPPPAPPCPTPTLRCSKIFGLFIRSCEIVYE
jgi:hypothetical protein